MSFDEDFEITMEMEVLISATAIQFSFGLPYVSLVHFREIVIHRDKYYSSDTGHYHKGEVNQSKRRIVLSWKHYLEGYITSDDALNVGIHEMTHTFHIENSLVNKDYGYLDSKIFNHWHWLSKQEIEKIRTGENQFFRSYGGTNTHEFFAVAVECFFEKPFEFEQECNELYLTLTKLLNQDPRVLYSK